MVPKNSAAGARSRWGHTPNARPRRASRLGRFGVAAKTSSLVMDGADALHGSYARTGSWSAPVSESTGDSISTNEEPLRESDGAEIVGEKRVVVDGEEVMIDS
jgi:hypothetical protein